MTEEQKTQAIDAKKSGNGKPKHAKVKAEGSKRIVVDKPAAPVGSFVDTPADASVKMPGEKGIARKLLPLWIVLAVLVVLAGACAGGIHYFQSHTLPGVTLWGNSVMGMTEDEIESAINTQLNDTKIPVTYEGKTENFTLSQLGVEVSAKNTASQLFNAKRSENWYDITQYFPWESYDVSPEVDTTSATSSVIDGDFGIETVEPVSASVTTSEDNSSFVVTPSSLGYGADVNQVIEAGLVSLKSLGKEEPTAVDLKVGDIEPKVSDNVANDAQITLADILANKVEIKVEDTSIYTFDAPALVAVSSINPDKDEELPDSQARNGYCVFDANKIQSYWNETIKPNFSSTREDRNVVVNAYGDELEVVSEGHDGVTVADGSDTTIGQDLLSVFEKGSGSISVKGQADPMQTKTTKKHVVVSLSAHRLYAYENDELVMEFGCGLGEGNDPSTGAEIADFATPAGDFQILRKVYNETMKGEVKRSDGTTEKWEVPNIGFANYITGDGVCIHRMSVYMNDSQIKATKYNFSHGCVALGWDIAEQFYNWAPVGTSVHIEY